MKTVPSAMPGIFKIKDPYVKKYVTYAKLIVLALVAWKILKYFNLIPKGDPEKKDLSGLAAQGITQTYMDSEYQAFAENLNQYDGDMDWQDYTLTSWIGNDDEDGIQAIAQKMKNNADLLKMSIALAQGSYGASLQAYLNDVFEVDEKDTYWNNWTEANGCTIRY